MLGHSTKSRHEKGRAFVEMKQWHWLWQEQGGMRGCSAGAGPEGWRRCAGGLFG